MEKNNFVTFLAAGVIILAYTVMFGFPEQKINRNVTTNKNENIVEIVPTETPIIERGLNQNYLVGIWQDQGGVVAGWSDHYNFYADGKFSFYTSQMNCSERHRVGMGSWMLDNDRLILTTIKQIVLTGGKVVVAGGACGTKTALVGETETTKVLTKPLVEVFDLSLKDRAEFDNYDSINIGEKQFWKLENDPTSTVNGVTEFPEWE